MKLTLEITDLNGLQQAAQLLAKMTGLADAPQVETAKPPKAQKPAATQPAAETVIAKPEAAEESPFEGIVEVAEEPAATLEEVRAFLAGLSKQGKAAQVKGLLSDFGVSKLTDVPADKYGALLAAAKEI